MSTVGEALKRTQTLKHIESPTSSLLSPKMITAHSAD